MVSFRSVFIGRRAVGVFFAHNYSVSQCLSPLRLLALKAVQLPAEGERLVSWPPEFEPSTSLEINRYHRYLTNVLQYLVRYLCSRCEAAEAEY